MGKGVRTAPAVALVCAALLAGTASAQPVAEEAPVGCGETAATRVQGARVVLDAVVLSPPGELERPALRAPNGRWRWFRPARIAVRDGETDVAVSVPLGWRDRVAVSWGKSPSAGGLRFDRCAAAARGWSVYEGGFHLRRRGDCVPLIVRVGGTSTTVRLGLGRACGASRPA
jgi:hypothetical protein